MEDNIFSKVSLATDIFNDKSTLSPHYIPSKLPYREEEIKNVVTLLTPVLKREKPSNIFIYGKTGVGKTIVTRFVSNELLEMCKDKDIGMYVTYINNKVHDSKYRVLVKLLKDLWEQNKEYFEKKGKKVHDSGAPPTMIYETLIDYIQDLDVGILIILDEIDIIKDVDSLLYTLTRANDVLKKGFISIIGISNNIFFKRQLDPRSKSTLCEEELLFPPYNAKQLTKILKERTLTGFKENVIDDSAIRLIAAIASKEGGDARYALRLLRKSGEVAEQNGGDTVETKEVEEAKSGVEEDLVLESLNTLPTHQQLSLLAIANLCTKEQRNLVGDTRKQFMSGEVYEEYRCVCGKIREKARSMRWVREYLNDLEMLGFISMQFSGRGSRGQTRLIELGEDPTKICSYIKKSLEMEE
jgi:archaeal cell division control protein 6